MCWWIVSTGYLGVRIMIAFRNCVSKLAYYSPMMARYFEDRQYTQWILHPIKGISCLPERKGLLYSWWGGISSTWIASLFLAQSNEPNTHAELGNVGNQLVQQKTIWDIPEQLKGFLIKYQKTHRAEIFFMPSSL